MRRSPLQLTSGKPYGKLDLMTLTEYWDALNAHDWYYEYSDDGRVWAKGEAAWNRLTEICHQSPEHKALRQAFIDHYYSGPPWNNVQAPKPIRPGASIPAVPNLPSTDATEF